MFSSAAIPGDTRAPSSRWPHPVVAAALSAIVPGLGQIAAGHRRRGWWYIGLTALFVVPAAVLFVMVFYVTGIGLAIDISRPFFRNPDLLLALLAANAASLAFRVMAAVDAYLLAAGPGRRGRVATGVTVAGLALVLLLTAVPHVWVGHRNLLLHDLLTHDFATDPNQAATTTITTTPPTTVLDGISTTTAAPTTTTAAPTTTTTTRPDPFADGDRVNVLLLGSDAGIGRTGVRTDTMIVLSVDPETGWTAMFGIPRNFIRLPIPPDHPAYPLWPDGVWGDPSNLAWGVYAYGLNNPELFAGANTGGDAAKTILGNLLGLEVDYFAMVDLQGFADIVDALGGVEITVTERIYDDDYTHPGEPTTVIDFPPGTYHMDGRDALAFARSRHQADDFARMGRQRCVLEALAREADPVRLLRELPALVPAIQASVVTDIPMAIVPDFLDVLSKVDTTQIVSIRFMPNAPEFAGTSSSYVAYRIQGYNVPNVELIRERVVIATTRPPFEAIIELNLQALDTVCGVTPLPPVE
ncbi:MAG TPA: LCP family protein [Acidimicrobiia bacterium]|nr:LCP family protein [Acidimicrobiia bacterium]